MPSIAVSSSWVLLRVPDERATTMARRSAAMAAAAFFALFAVAAPLLCAPAAAELVRLEHAAKNDGSLSLLVVGDWGRKGTYNQSRVAQQVTAADELPNPTQESSASLSMQMHLDPLHSSI